MKIVNSLKTLKNRDKGCRIVRRKGEVLSHQQGESTIQGAPGVKRL